MDLYSFYNVESKRIALQSDIVDVKLCLDSAIPLGFVINELISNSLKHAFPGDKGGEISIYGRETPENITLVVKDNGIGIPDAIDWRNPESLGLRLAISLISQNDGTIELDTTAGTMYSILIPKKH